MCQTVLSYVHSKVTNRKDWKKYLEDSGIFWYRCTEVDVVIVMGEVFSNAKVIHINTCC